MATFLTTPRMDPALRARVERSVSNRKRARQQAQQLGMGRMFEGRARLGTGRLIPLGALAVVAALIGLMARQDRIMVEEQRAAVLATLEAHRDALPAGHEAFLALTELQATAVAADPYAGDVVAPELREPGALDAWLSRPALYLRGATPELRDSPGIAEAAATSIKDAFLRCLVQPPASRDEKAVLGMIRGVSFGGALVERETANVRRLVEAQEGLAMLGSAVEARARSAESVGDLQKLEKELTAAPLDAAEVAVSAELLIVVADESDEVAKKPKKSGDAEDSLGYRAQERVHDARVALVDLGSGKVLLRVRRRLDASRRSEHATSLYRAAIQGCDLALDVRAAADD